MKGNNTLSIENYTDSTKHGYLSNLEFLQKQLLITAINEKSDNSSLNSDLYMAKNYSNSDSSCLNQNHSNNANKYKEDSTILNSKYVIPPPGFLIPNQTSSKPSFLVSSSSSSSSNFSSVNNSSNSTPPTDTNGQPLHRGSNQEDTNLFSKSLHSTLKSILPNANISFGYNNSNIIPNNTHTNPNNINSLSSLNSNIDLCWPDDPAIITSFTESSLLNGINTCFSNYQDSRSDVLINQTEKDSNSERINNQIQSNHYINNLNNFYNNSISNSINNHTDQSIQNNISCLKFANNLSNINDIENSTLQPHTQNAYGANQALLQHFQILTNIYQSKFNYINYVIVEFLTCISSC
jgi:hypothetical protein